MPDNVVTGTNIFNYFSETEVEGGKKGKKGRRIVGKNWHIFVIFSAKSSKLVAIDTLNKKELQE